MVLDRVWMTAVQLVPLVCTARTARTGVTARWGIPATTWPASAHAPPDWPEVPAKKVRHGLFLFSTRAPTWNKSLRCISNLIYTRQDMKANIYIYITCNTPLVIDCCYLFVWPAVRVYCVSQTHHEQHNSICADKSFSILSYNHFLRT